MAACTEVTETLLMYIPLVLPMFFCCPHIQFWHTLIQTAASAYRRFYFIFPRYSCLFCSYTYMKLIYSIYIRVNPVLGFWTSTGGHLSPPSFYRLFFPSYSIFLTLRSQTQGLNFYFKNLLFLLNVFKCCITSRRFKFINNNKAWDLR